MTSGGQLSCRQKRDPVSHWSNYWLHPWAALNPATVLAQAPGRCLRLPPLGNQPVSEGPWAVYGKEKS